MSFKGLDVSQFQGSIDWSQVKNAGYQFAMLRAGYGYNTIDEQFHRNASECNSLAFLSCILVLLRTNSRDCRSRS